MLSLRNIIQVMVISFLLMQIFSDTSYSQDDSLKNSWFFELIGNGGVYSVNYDRLLTNSTSLRAGFSYLPWPTDISAITFPVMFNILSGVDNSKLEIGLGIMIFSISGWHFPVITGNKSSGVFMAGSIGYRYQPKVEGPFYRVTFTPYYGYDTLFPCLGFSIGKTF
jgi:hypothetical protein